MMKRRLSLALAVVVVLASGSACGPGQQMVPDAPSAEPPTAPPPTDTPEAAVIEPSVSVTPVEPTPVPAFDGLPLPMDQGTFFAGSGACANCHTGLVDEGGNDVSNDTNWRAAIMANAARDPYWRAAVRSETLDLPDLRAVIEDRCANCHTPMAHFTAVQTGLETNVLDDGFLDQKHKLHALAIDGVSCTLCHQIEETNLGTVDSFSGGYSIDHESPTEGRLAFGPFPVAPGPAALMQDVSGYLPIEGPHTTTSELCATCHTLYTPYVDADGQIAGEFPEQVPYLEWKHSGYAETQACQDCHMPPAEGAVQLASIGGLPPRSPFAQHLFIGGNVYMLKLLRTFGEEHAVTASREDFDRKIDQTLEQLQGRTATITIDEAEIADSRLAVAVAIENQAGHKLPTGFPARRVWLHLAVTDASGDVLFESGAVNADGSIAGNENDADPATFEPHYEEISSPEQVQVYEAILENTEDAVTTRLLEAMGYQKDNRLLPSGFDKGTAGGDIGVYGSARDDDDFEGGGDVVRFMVDLGEAQGPFIVEAALLYQSIGTRWAENLRPYEAPEIATFLSNYDEVPNEPTVLASASANAGR
ncbi:MAG: hypothetical protein PVH41_15540 [Anaerolineae bacterium]|jgi:hypothetical protein